jgi:hypothetical protein
MDQAKTRIPYFAGYREFEATTLKQKLMGVLVHGVGVFFYRTFDNVSSDANLYIEVLMRTLAKLPSLPRHLMIQVDGGPENTAQVSYAMTCVLARKGLLDKVREKARKRQEKREGLAKGVSG